MIQLIDLRKSFEQQQVLRGVNLTIPKGQVTAIIGRSGGGKSVLLKHLIGLMRPDSGQVLVDGTDLARLRGKALDLVREKFGVLFQGCALFDSLTVFDNVAFPLREKTRLSEGEIAKRTMQRLEAVGLADMPHKYPAELSGGMKKRAALARALVHDPQIILFDEPTTGLDPILLHSVHRLILDAHKRFGFTAVVVSHDIPEIFDIAQTVAMLHNGVIVEHDSPEVIMTSANPIIRQFITGASNGQTGPE
ncbi:MAG: ABC transporter ATP-binding protein [Candidatus Methylomirabilis oxygeniifera]|uniref:Putative ABC transporter (ATP-binding protein) n=1 Tax=Methylomirabilis oxygeniifera TaxID=671143 RepID=D5MHX9_METO1|nr:MAG: ABC transporter ATP-binding protein [Candidatus Methylomirabilis oxyfera]CBE69270.1 Putative ABC transporter (ATP-binding protein) [Candidatus Methylomirabilis oxyfera]